MRIRTTEQRYCLASMSRRVELNSSKIGLIQLSALSYSRDSMLMRHMYVLALTTRGRYTMCSIFRVAHTVGANPDLLLPSYPLKPVNPHILGRGHRVGDDNWLEDGREVTMSINRGLLLLQLKYDGRRARICRPRIATSTSCGDSSAKKSAGASPNKTITFRSAVKWTPPSTTHRGYSTRTYTDPEAV
jgi:hypothetical protein